MATKRVTQVIIDLPAPEPAKDAHSPRIGSNGNWEVWNDTTNQYEDTGHSPIGKDGAIAYPAGYWTNSIVYTKTTEIAPYVQHGDLFYLLIKDGSWTGVNPQTDVANNGGHWRLFDTYQAIFTDALVAAFAKIGGAVFTGDTPNISEAIRSKLISQKGLDGTKNYHTYGQGSWKPKLMLDFDNGLADLQAGTVGSLDITDSGDIAMFSNDATPQDKLLFRKANLPLITDLVNGVNSNGSTTVGSGATSTSVVLEGNVYVSKDGALATIGALTIDLVANGKRMADGSSSMASAKLYLRKNGVRWVDLADARVFFTEDSTNHYQQVGVASITSNSLYLDIGAYTFELVIETQGDVIYKAANSTATTFAWTHIVQGIKRQQYGLNGMMFFYSGGHFYFVEDEFMDAKAPADKWNAPGVLLSATVLTGGTFLNWWGAKKHSSYTATKNSTGRYTVYHSIGHSNYQVTATPSTASKSCHIVSQGNDNFVIEWRTIGSTPALSDTGFSFQITGNNYA